MSVKGFFFILVFFLVAIMGFLIYISETVVVKYLYIADADDFCACCDTTFCEVVVLAVCC